MSLPLASDFEIPQPEEVGSTVRLFPESSMDDGEEPLSLKNLQSLMDGEPMLQILLGTRNAIDVIRYFKTFPATIEEEEREELPKTSLEKVTELQENIYKKVETLEKAKLNMQRREVPYVDHMADELSASIASIQNSWRKELTAIMEVLATITDGYTEVKKGVDTVLNNHEELTRMIVGESESSSSVTSSSEESEEEEELKPKSSRGSIMAPARGSKRRSQF
jgi:hypothetical protein